MKKAGWEKDQISFMDELDRYELEKEKREVQAVLDKLNRNYTKVSYKDLEDGKYTPGTVVIIGQNVFKKNHYTKHFYRTVLDFHRTLYGREAHMVESQNEEWPDIPPWAHTVNHEGEARDIHADPMHEHWVSGEIVEPIETWWIKQWGR